MKNPEPDQSNAQLLARRAFIISAAAAISGAAFWALRKTTLLQPQPVDASTAPANVTIVKNKILNEFDFIF